MGRFITLFIILFMLAFFFFVIWGAIKIVGMNSHNSKTRKRFGKVKSTTDQESINPYLWTILVCGSLISIFIGILEYLAISGYFQFGIIGLGVAIGAGIVSWIHRKRKNALTLKKRDGINRDDIIAKINTAKDLLNKIYNYSNHGRCADLKDKLRNIVKSGNDLIDELNQRPEDVMKLSNYMDFYLQQTMSVVQRYTEIEDKRERDIVLNQLTPVLNNLDYAFAEKVEMFKKREKFDLNVDIKLLEQEIKTRRI